MRAGDCICVYSTHRININRLLPFRKKFTLKKISMHKTSIG